MAITISKSEIERFCSYRISNRNGLRLGQAFHQYFKLEKITNEEDKIFCDRLYEMDGDEARKAIESITDYGQ